MLEFGTTMLMTTPQDFLKKSVQPSKPPAVRGAIVLVRGDIVRKKRVFRPDETLDPASPAHALTRFRCLGRAAGISFLEAVPETGRPHQIRATLKAIGFPVVGDKLYGVDETIYARMCADAMTPEDVAALRMSRQALHAQSLAFRHPFTHQPHAIAPSWMRADR